MLLPPTTNKASMAMELEKRPLGLDSSADQMFFNAVESCPIDVTNKQKILLTHPLSKSLAFWGVRGLPPGRFSEVSNEGHGWYWITTLILTHFFETL